MASLTIVVRCLRATSPTKPVPIGIVVPISFWLATPSASLQRSASPSAIHSEPPAAPTAVSTVSNTLGSSSSKSSEELNSWLIECSRRRRSSSTRRSSAGTAGAPDSSAMRWKRRAARASLRQALKRLRAAVGDLLHVDRHAVQVRGSIECDVTQFLHALERSPREAAGFDVPRFLSGFALRHAPVFEEWATVKRRWLLRRFGELLRGLARAAIAQSHWREALDWAERWLACEPLSDEAARLVIESLYLAGDGGAALARFREYRDRLAHEIDAPPSAAMLELVRRIERDAERPRRRGAADLSPSAPCFEASLVGRESQWRTLMGVWDAVTRAAGRVVVIEGEAGVGKTRLAEDFLRWALAAGATVLRGRGYDARTGIPYGPFLEALRGVLQTPGLAGTAPEWLAEVTRLLPELRQRFPTLPEAAAAVDVDRRWRLFEGIAQLVLSIAAERPTIVFIDDVQWCDTESCALLHFLARRFERSPVAVVATLTLGEFERDAPAARLARALRTHAHASVVALAPLTKDEVWLLIREMGRISAPTGGRRFAERVHAVTDGNPFHVVELIKTLFAQGLLAIAPGTGEWVAPSVPSGVSYAVHRPRVVRARHVPAARGRTGRR